ncbi:hypothetical protein L8C07_25760 [Paenibacillus sp. CMAA1739]|uniref:hypothetical protein n=1 Tax=Paenibacillus ottowii TaxID=2315729 RepID=UPI00272F18EA|nr:MULTISPECIES: hypothetical protein [Paenibacillus]MDP1513059.1 hypothetical protein [Paenibacillus ottowii]MEC4569357.1 hypothetical protein [Paenibacillus sp. CMAA1739]
MNLKFIKPRITIESIKTLTPKQVESFHEMVFWGDPQPGEVFYNFKTDSIHTLTSDTDENGEFALVHENGVCYDFESCLPLFTVSQLLDLVTFDASFEMRYWGGGWLIIYDGEFYETNKKEDLVDLLFDLLKTKLY